MVEQLEHKFGFENLDVWQSSIDLSKFVYELTSNFPKEETYGLVSQMRRAIVSVSSNIAEGTCKASLKEQAKFSEIAFGSLMETLNQLIIAYSLGYLDIKDYDLCRECIEKTSRQLNALKNSQLRRLQNV